MLNTNGSLYTTFTPPNPSLVLRGANYFPKSGKIGIFGSFTAYGGVSGRERVAVIDANTGAPDNNFNDRYFASIGQDGWMGKEV
jgi:hypothetical protein